MENYFRKTAIANAILLALAACPAAYAAVGDPVGSPISIGNDGSDDPVVAMGAAGNFVVAWRSTISKNPSVRCFNADGTPASDAVTIPAPTTVNDYIALAADGAGNSVVTWDDSSDAPNFRIYAQRLDSLCALQGDIIDIGASVGNGARVAMAADGRFVVARYTSDGLLAQRYDAEGNALGSPIASSGGIISHVASRPDGGFVVMWDPGDVHLRYYDADGNPETDVITYAIPEGSAGANARGVAMDGDGDVVVTWDSWDDYQIYAQRFDASGNAVGGLLTASDATADYSAGYYKDMSKVAMDDDGDFWLVWEGMYNLTGALAQRFDSADNKGATITVDTGAAIPPDVAMDPDGDAVVVWMYETNLYAQRYEGKGQTVDLSVTGAADTATINAGNDVTYTWTVTNNGSGTAVAISLDDVVPSGLSYLRFSDSAADGWDCSDSSGTVTCTLPRLVSGGSSSVELILDSSALSGSTVDNSATGSTPMSDTDSSNDSDTVSLAVNGAPTFDATPVVSGTAALGNTLSVTTPGATDPEGDGITVSYRWQADGVDIAGATADSYTVTSAAAHAEVTVVLTVTDTGGAFSTATASAGTVPNSPPGFDATPTIGGSADIGNTLTVDAAATDADGDGVTLSYQWKADGADIAGATGDSYTLTSTEVHAAITVVVTADDGYDTSTVNSGSVTVANRLPTFDATPSISGTALVGNTLSVSDTATSDADGDTVSLSYQWQADGIAISDATSDSYTLTSDAAHSDITVVVTADDGYDSTVVTTAGVSVGDTAPVISSVSISGSTLPGETVTAVASGKDSDGDSLSYSYEWYVDGALVGTADSYTIGSGDSGKAIFTIVTASDGNGGSDSSSSTAQIIGNNAPVFDATPTLSGSAYVGNTLSVSGVSASDADGDSISYSYQWTANGTAISGAVSDSYTLTTDEAHAFISVTVTASDSGGGSTAISSGSVIALNSSPVFDGTPAISGSNGVGDILTLSGLAVSDTDNDSISYSYMWLVGGSMNGSDSSYTIQSDDAGKSVTALIIASDGYGGIVTTTTSEMTVSNTSGSSSGGGGALGWWSLLGGLLWFRRRK